MKKIALLFVLIFCITSMKGQDITTFRIGEVNSSELKPGDVVKVPVYFEEITEELKMFLIFVTYDKSVLEYVATSDKNPVFKNGWKDNLADNFYAVFYAAFGDTGQKSKQLGKLCDLEFKYKGGETKIGWGKENIIEESVKKMGKTEAIGTEDQNIALKLIDGCVCPASE